MSREIPKITLDEFIFSHQELSRHRDMGDDASANLISFMAGIRSGALRGYRGKFVAYQKGVFCGSSIDGQLLYNQGVQYYGGSSFAVFSVPVSLALRPNLNDAMGEWK